MNIRTGGKVLIVLTFHQPHSEIMAHYSICTFVQLHWFFYFDAFTKSKKKHKIVKSKAACKMLVKSAHG